MPNLPAMVWWRPASWGHCTWHTLTLEQPEQVPGSGEEPLEMAHWPQCLCGQGPDTVVKACALDFQPQPSQDPWLLMRANRRRPCRAKCVDAGEGAVYECIPAMLELLLGGVPGTRHWICTMGRD